MRHAPQTFRIAASVIDFLAFTLCDIALILWFNLACDIRRADSAAMMLWLLKQRWH